MQDARMILAVRSQKTRNSERRELFVELLRGILVPRVTRYTNVRSRGKNHFTRLQRYANTSEDSGYKKMDVE